LALIHHHTRSENGEFVSADCSEYSSPAEFVVARIPDGVPFRCYRDGVEISKDVDAMLQDGEFIVIESPGGGVFRPILNLISKVFSFLVPKVKTPEINQQATSANNSLTDRNNEPRPYKRVYDICGTVQSIPSDLMLAYKSYDDSHKEFEFGYYYIARGFVDTPESGITDGDTLGSTISGWNANIYDPFTSPNNSAPRQIIGELIDEPLFIGVRSNSVDGISLKAPNEFELKLTGVTITCQLTGVYGSLVDATGEMSFDDMFKLGDAVTLSNVKSFAGLVGSFPTYAVLDGNYTVSAISQNSISFDVTSNLAQWQKIQGGSSAMESNSAAKILPQNSAEIGFTDWVTISSISPERLLINIVAQQGMYKTPGGSSSTQSASATVEVQWQAMDQSGLPVGPVTSVSKTLKDKSRDEVGMSVKISIPSPSPVRVRVRRSSNLDTNFNGTVVDALKYRDLYGQIIDTTPHYGDMTTIHTQRKGTVQATAIKSPQLKLIATEMIFKYLGGGAFDTVRTKNTRAAQSIIRLMRDQLIGNLTLSTACMDGLLAAQESIEDYFGNPDAGQFCYTFDDANGTAQDIAQTIAEAVFCTIGRDGNDIKLYFDRPVTGPAMVFTHRSKVGEEKWTQSFAYQAKDSVEFIYTDPKTNIRETIKIPETGGVNPNKIDSKGVRSYQQAYWLAHRARQKDLLQKRGVEFTAMHEGIYVTAGEAISVVKGARVASFDGYIVAQSGLTLTLSQEVAFTPDDDHFILLKRRDGSAESIRVEPGTNARTVVMLSSPVEPVYTGNSATKTEFSFGNEARHLAQMIIPLTVDPQENKTVKITGKNYHPDIYLFDGVTTGGAAFSNAFSNAFDI
jgi:hypothetical protein